MSIERRRDLRVAVRGAYAELFIGPASTGLFMIGDVSDSGLFLMTPSPTIPSGTRVTARLEDGLVLKGMIVHVSTTGHTGYGIELDDPPYDTVERVALPTRPSTFAPPASTPAPGSSAGGFGNIPRTGTTDANPGTSTAGASDVRILVILADAELGTAMTTALNAFKYKTSYLPPDAQLLAALSRISGNVDVALVDAVTIAARGPLSAQSLKAHVRARTLVLYSHGLPGTEERRQYQALGIDQLWVAPLLPFEAMDKLAKKVRKR